MNSDILAGRPRAGRGAAVPRGVERKADSVALLRSPAAHARPAGWEAARVLGEEGDWARLGRAAAEDAVAVAAAVAAAGEGAQAEEVAAGEAHGDADAVGGGGDGAAVGRSAAAAAEDMAGVWAAGGAAGGAGHGWEGEVVGEWSEEQQRRAVSWSPLGNGQGGRQAMRSRLSYDVVGTRGQTSCIRSGQGRQAPDWHWGAGHRALALALWH